MDGKGEGFHVNTIQAGLGIILLLLHPGVLDTFLGTMCTSGLCGLGGRVSVCMSARQCVCVFMCLCV